MDFLLTFPFALPHSGPRRDKNQPKDKTLLNVFQPLYLKPSPFAPAGWITGKKITRPHHQ
ncbi:MAG: hypothetical protein A2512_03280 [Deltaproteobacteria bacterium RIFOXYD12_FULL_56_24]|nr:MAG: hypothetical protein A2512_03280 [Deltaproteobacteria bacterium RIFOXYD12_FULL_56_24]